MRLVIILIVASVALLTIAAFVGERPVVNEDRPYLHEGHWYIDSTPAACAWINGELVCEKLP